MDRPVSGWHSPNRRRMLTVIAVAAAIELGVAGIARLLPAMAGLARPIYAVIAVVAVIALWHAARHRAGGERRQEERRDPSTSDPTD